MLIVIDPGSKPAYLVSNPAHVLARGPAWRDWELPVVLQVTTKYAKLRWEPPVTVVCESQDIREGKDPRRILQLARTAGMQAMRFGGPVHWLTAQRWRETLQVTSLRKEQVQARVREALTPAEAKLITTTDCLDAVAILWAAYRLGARLREYVENPP